MQMARRSRRRFGCGRQRMVRAGAIDSRGCRRFQPNRPVRGRRIGSRRKSLATAAKWRPVRSGSMPRRRSHDSKADSSEDASQPTPAIEPQPTAERDRGRTTADRPLPQRRSPPKNSAPASKHWLAGRSRRKKRSRTNLPTSPQTARRFNRSKSSGQGLGSSATADRARDAFRDKAAAPASDRYGASALRRCAPSC